MNAPVILRNGETAFVTGRVSVPPFALVGRQASGVLELWQKNGAWREDSQEHPLDIVSRVTPAGQLVALNGASPV